MRDDFLGPSLLGGTWPQGTSPSPLSQAATTTHLLGLTGTNVTKIASIVKNVIFNFYVCAA